MLNLNKKDTIITANKRQILALRQWYIGHYQTKELSVILPRIIDYQSFLIQQYTQHINQKALLNNYEQYLIWQEIIYAQHNKFKQYDLTLELFQNYHSLTQTLQNEYSLLRQFKIKLSALQDYFNDKTQLFLAIIDQYQQKLAKLHCLDLFDVADILTKHQDLTRSDGQYYYYGFKQLTPQQAGIFTTIDATELNTIYKFGGITQQCVYETVESELSSAVDWLNEQSRQNPQQSLALIVPNLGQLRHKVIRQIDRVFGLNQQIIDSTQKPYNLSLGQFLSHYSMIKSAINILLFAYDYQQNLTLDKRLPQVLLSGFIAGCETEVNERHQLHCLLTNQLVNKQSLVEISQSKTPLFHQQLIALETLLTTDTFDKKQTHHQWMGLCQKILDVFAWGQAKTLSSSQYQLFNKYHQLTLTFNRLDRLNTSISFYQALWHWIGLLSQTPFQPKLAQQTNIYIIGQLEAQGLFFDQAWIMGLDTTFLPGKIKKYVFIPSVLAVEYSLFKSSYELLADDAKVSANQLTQLAKTHYLSYAKVVSSQTRLPSPYFTFNSYFKLSTTLPKVQKFTILVDSQAPTLAHKHINNGIRAIKYQLQCPFKGFARRLNIPEFEEVNIGISPIEKGQYIHQTLEKIYQKIRTQADLSKIEDISHFVWQYIKQIYPISENIFWQLEAKRAKKIIANFLALELSRSKFEVLAVEKEQKVKLANLSFKIRLDRLDKDEYDNQIIIDYKTSTPKLSQIGLLRTGFGQISEPQLAVYALNNPIDALAFVQLQSEQVKWIGCGKTEVLEDYFKKNSDSEQFSALKKYWQQQLEKAAEDFQQGKAEVLPQKNACEYCQLDPLCRV